MGFLIMALMVVVALFLILLVLVQRGRGGGLAGAFGGMGGQSAFGTKAGDLFTKVTIGVATFWILLCLVADKYFATQGEDLLTGTTQNAPGTPGSKKPAKTGAGTEGGGEGATTPGTGTESGGGEGAGSATESGAGKGSESAEGTSGPDLKSGAPAEGPADSGKAPAEDKKE